MRIERVNVGKALVKIMIKNNIKHVFGLPGTQTLPIYKGIMEEEPNISHLLFRCERCAALAATAYSKVILRPSVCDATAGPGATNAVTGVAEAWSGSVPLICVTSDVHLSMKYKWAQQEIDQVNILKPIVKRSFFATKPEDAVRYFNAAFRLSISGRPGPIHVDLPADILLSDIDYVEEHESHETYHELPYKRIEPSDEDLNKAVDIILKSNKITIIAGGGVLYSQAENELLEFSEIVGAAVATTPFGKGCFPETHPLSIGVASILNEPSLKILDDSDLIIIIGSKMDQFATSSWQLPLYSKEIIHIDIDPEEIGRNYPIKVGLIGDAKTTLRKLIKIIKAKVKSSNKKSVREELIRELMAERERKIKERIEFYGNKPNPYGIIKELEKILPNDAVLIGDASSSAWWLVYLYKLKGTGRIFLRPSSGCIGAAFPFALGAKVAREDKVVVGVGGDGGFGMSLHELETAKRLGLPVIYIVFNDSALGWISFDEKELGFNKSYSTSFSQLNFDQIAKAYGCNGIEVKEQREFKEAIKEAINSDIATVIDIKMETFYPPKELRL
jgi:acetolactate synthase-1/2/3 large subunit